ncbi:MAG TPA: malto-oligosyltrehalose synthase, partial [Candidatus Competibacteraceae bacterium]|nr:malto-oligosyltrehalose synthase [Candidatus Competibacteraceae bacterium]
MFQHTHRLILKLLAEGKLSGLRIDHPHGLYNPKQYFQRLQEALVAPVKNGAPLQSDAKPLYVVVEKILESYERLPEDWPVHGTIGYDFANLVNALLIDGEAEERLTQIYANFIETEIDFAELLYWCKRLIMNTALASELNVLATQLSRIAEADRNTRDFTLHGLHGALKEVVAWFPVYRTYVTPAGVSEEDKRYVNWAISVAKKRSQVTDIGIFDFLHNVLLTLETEDKPTAFREQVIAFAMKFQQYTGPLMAKGLEDTAFYRYNRLASLNEVGGDPTRFSVSVNGFHHANQERARLWPHSLLATSTHDSKRSEDVRARLNVLSEVPEAWEKRLQRWSRLNQNERRLVDNKPAPSRNDEYLLYQTSLGAWPLEDLDEAGLEAFRQRIENYMLKAVKEAKVHSSWVNPNPEYEGAIVAFIQALLKPGKNRFLEDFLPDQRRIARLGLFNSLSQTLIKLTAPGVPDIYQGTELWDFSLVDPDNRRPVDYERRRALLTELQTLVETAGDDLAGRVRGLLDRMEDGRPKLYVNWRTLRMRREQSELFRH